MPTMTTTPPASCSQIGSMPISAATPIANVVLVYSALL